MRYLARAVDKNLKVSVKREDGAQALEVITPARVLTNMTSLQPYMFPPEMTDKAEARKSFKRYGHWKKVDFEWVEISKIGIPDEYNPGETCDEVCLYWKKFLENRAPMPAIRVYSDEDLSMVSDGVQRLNALKAAGYKYALVYYRYETNDDPP